LQKGFAITLLIANNTTQFSNFLNYVDKIKRLTGTCTFRNDIAWVYTPPNSIRSVLQNILFNVNDPSLQEGFQIASAGSGLLEFLHDHAEASGAIIRV
jgi:hypothetical protein